MEEFRDNFLKFYIDKEEQMEHIKMGRISTDEIGGFANLVWSFMIELSPACLIILMKYIVTCIVCSNITLIHFLNSRYEAQNMEFTEVSLFKYYSNFVA